MWLDIAGRRIALVVAHPDDETLYAGAHLKYWPDLTVIHITDGAPRDGKDAAREGFPSWREYAAARRIELDCALAAGEARHARRVELAVPDQQAIERLPDIMRDLPQALRGCGVVLTHCYEGGHPDHDACAVACRAVLPPRAELWEFAGYHAGNGGLESGQFLDPDGRELRFAIRDEDLRRKLAMIGCFLTQRGILSQLRSEAESFRRARDVDFSKPPHRGRLLYEAWGFPIDGARWRALACEALAC